jgi:uncharacterized protein (TIGR01777 family)
MPQHIAITGASGLIGRRLAELLRQQGHTVYELRRVPPPPTSATHATWNPATGEITTPTPIDALIHLAGKNIAIRWTAAAKKEIWDSRVPATRKLAAHLAGLPAGSRPKLLISASAIGIYGNRGDEVLTEESPLAPPGTMFMADICREWEAATKPAEDAGIRTIHPRIGVVLSKDGGALQKLLTPTKLFLGGPVGSGTQFMPTISLTDLSRLLAHLTTGDHQLSGPVNAVGPAPVRQHEFMRTLGTLLHRPAVFPLPAFVVKLAFGRMGEEALLSSLRVIPTRLPGDFPFLHSTLADALRAEL